MKAIENALLDFDGTLLDSNAAHAQAWKEYLLNKTGLNLPIGRIARMMGMGGDKVLTELFGDKYSESEMKKMSGERDDYYTETQTARLKPIAGAVEFVAELARRGIRAAVASSAKQKLLDPALLLVPIRPYIIGFSTPDEAEHSKPAPDIFSAAMKKFNFDPNRTAVIGDSPYDIIAAKRAGCLAAIAVQSGNFPAPDLQIADEVWPDVDQLRRNLHRSILGR